MVVVPGDGKAGEMKRRAFVQGTSIRKQVLRQRRIHTSLSSTWQTLRKQAEELPRDVKPVQVRPA